MTRKLKNTEYNAILAGLRALQMVLDGDPHRKAQLDEILDNSGAEGPLDSNGIEVLVDALQYGEVKLPVARGRS